MRRAKRLAVIGGAALAAVALVACGGDDEGSGTVTRLGTAEPEGSATASTVTLAPGETATEVGVTLSEWAVEPAVAEMDAGVVEFVVTNAGSEPHELVVIRSDAELSALPVTDGLVPEDAVDFRGEVPEFDAGTTVPGMFRLEAGRYLLLCNIPAHYENGMVAEFVVR